MSYPAHADSEQVFKARLLNQFHGLMAYLWLAMAMAKAVCSIIYVS